MAKVVALVCDVTFNSGVNKAELKICGTLVPEAGDSFTGVDFPATVTIDGTETPQQINNLVENELITGVSALFGVTIQANDIRVTKFS